VLVGQCLVRNDKGTEREHARIVKQLKNNCRTLEVELPRDKHAYVRVGIRIHIRRSPVELPAIARRSKLEQLEELEWL